MISQVQWVIDQWRTVRDLLLTPLGTAVVIVVGAIIVGYAILVHPVAPEKRTQRVPLRAIMADAVAEGWDFTSDHSLQLLDIADAIRQAGADGELRIWGRNRKGDFDPLTLAEPLLLLPPEHWRDHQIDPMPLIGPYEDIDVCSYRPGGDRDRPYADLHVDRDEARHWLRTSAAKFKGRRTR
ncbi:hypothetical protein [Dongia deserti]|uniref:hypothetical protein n=1 Tax=Dongia deserti TaxID=2268030 RepID=UPI000E654476|nr:hypothetical protein [Dongia deserti]